ncbi:MAG: TetR/AcrR family transcriptional regulator [Actinobacteria bacterium]|nr:TetR/AcrR family transcriptional regulator [Actinomycetota bacterium]
MSSSAPYGDPATRERILRAAWELIEERGADVRLVDVAARARVSRQALYLHFGNRSGLLIALVEFIDETLGLQEMVAHVFAAPTGAEMLERTMELYVRMAPRIDRVAQVLEAAQQEDRALAAAWRNRMANRQAVHRAIVQRVHDEGQLADAWTVDAAAHLFYAITMPGVWRELTKELGWTSDDYRRHITRLLERALLEEGSNG